MTQELKTFSIIEYCTGYFGDIGKHIGEIESVSMETAKAKFQLENNIKDSEVGFYGFSEIKQKKELVKEAKIIISKQKIIKEAWGAILETLTDKEDIDYIISNDGYFIDEKFMHTTEEVVFWCGIELNKHPLDNHKYRPKSLQGIENNNGWTKIESEKDLPKIEMQDCFIMDKTLGVIVGRFTLSEKNIWLENATHYQPIEKPKPPIY